MEKPFKTPMYAMLGLSEADCFVKAELLSVLNGEVIVTNSRGGKVA